MASTVQARPMAMPDFIPEQTVHLRLQSVNNNNVNMNPHPPSMPKPKAKLRLDPHRALEPVRKKLSTVEAQRIMAVLTDSIRKIELASIIPVVCEDPSRFSVSLGADLMRMLEDHKVIIQSYEELKNSAQIYLQREQRSSSVAQHEAGERDTSRPASQSSTGSQAEMALRNLSLVARQMQQSSKNIMRALARDPAAMSSMLKARGKKSMENAMIPELEELRDIIMGMLLTTPVEEMERNQYLKEVSERERYNAGIIHKLDAELQVAVNDKDREIQRKNDVIRVLTSDIDQIEKFSQDQNRKTKQEAEKQEAADSKNSEGKKGKLMQDINQLKTQLQSLIAEHRENETTLRQKKFKVETEVENWIQKYDQDMGERQAEFEEIDAVYTEEKKQLTELEERFKTLEEEYKAIMEERRIARERQEATERELQLNITAATCIQAFWRSFKVRKALKAKKKKKGGKKKGK